MKIEKITQVVFDEKEIEALRTVAYIDCSGIDCHKDGCPFDWKDERSCNCIKGMIKEMMLKNNISF